jgi:peroxiredoxin
LLNEEGQKPGREGLPHPATIIIDKEGKVRFVNVWVNYRERTPVATILAELEKLD